MQKIKRPAFFTPIDSRLPAVPDSPASLNSDARRSFPRNKRWWLWGVAAGGALALFTLTVLGSFGFFQKQAPALMMRIEPPHSGPAPSFTVLGRPGLLERTPASSSGLTLDSSFVPQGMSATGKGSEKSSPTPPKRERSSSGDRTSKTASLEPFSAPGYPEVEFHPKLEEAQTALTSLKLTPLPEEGGANPATSTVSFPTSKKWLKQMAALPSAPVRLPRAMGPVENPSTPEN